MNLSSISKFPSYFAITSPATIYQTIIILTIVTRNPAFLLFLGCGIIGEFLNHSLKSLVQEKRPDGCGAKIDGQCTGCGLYPEKGMFSETWGFPSGHAQFTSFAAMFWSIYLYKSKKGTGPIISISLLWLLAMLVWYQRVRSGCHSVQQVMAGAAMGIAFGFGFYMLCNKIAPGTFL